MKEQLELIIPGRTTDDLARGVAAAERIFADNRTEPAFAERSAQLVARSGASIPPARAIDAAAVFQLAALEALKAAMGGSDPPPLGWSLRVVLQ